MSTLQEVRDKVRAQTDLDDTDLPDTTLDGFIREAFDRTFAVERRWPFFQHTWTLTLSEGETSITLPTDTEVAVVSRLRSSNRINLMHIGHHSALDEFQGTLMTTTNPDMFSVWGNVLYLWPVPTSAARTYTLTGFRKPEWSGNPTLELDGDGRLHLALVHYAVALAYAQLEDTELEQSYMGRWSSLVETYQRELTRPMYHEPIVLNGGVNRSRSMNVDWNI